MARGNQFTRHPQRAEIERDIRAGVSSRAIAGQYGIRSFSSVAEYARRLRARDAERKAEQSGKTDADKLVERLDRLWNLLTQFLQKGYQSGRFDGTTVKAIGEARATIREIANIKGLMRGPGISIGIGVNVANANVNVQTTERDGVPANEVKAALFRALRGHPEARDSVVHEFQRLQQRHDGVVVGTDLIDVTPAPRARTRGADHDTAP